MATNTHPNDHTDSGNSDGMTFKVEVWRYGVELKTIPLGCTERLYARRMAENIVRELGGTHGRVFDSATGETFARVGWNEIAGPSYVF